MTSFVHTNFPLRHAGAERIESAVEAASQIRKSFNSTRGLSVMLLAAMVAALIVVADQLVDTWADGHLLAAWVMLWVVGFAALALLAAPARHLAARLMQALDTWSSRVARERADERLWSLAQNDPRVLADIQAAVTRAETDSLVSESARRVVQRQAVGRVERLTRRIWND